MKTSVMIALVGVVCLVAFAGVVAAAGPSMQVGAGSGGGASGMQMHQNGHMGQYGQLSNGCPMDHDNNYSWDHNYGGCGGSCPRA